MPPGRAADSARAEQSCIRTEARGKNWTVKGTAPGSAATLRVGLLLNAHGTAWFDDLELFRTERATPWPDLGTAERHATIRGDQIVQPRFGGVGFHVFHHVHPVTPQMFDEVVGKCWRELNPSFVRMNHSWQWDARADRHHRPAYGLLPDHR